MGSTRKWAAVRLLRGVACSKPRQGGLGAGPVVTQCWPGKLPQHVRLEKPEPGDPT